MRPPGPCDRPSQVRRRRCAVCSPSPRCSPCCRRGRLLRPVGPPRAPARRPRPPPPGPTGVPASGACGAAATPRRSAPPRRRPARTAVRTYVAELGRMLAAVGAGDSRTAEAARGRAEAALADWRTVLREQSERAADPQLKTLLTDLGTEVCRARRRRRVDRRDRTRPAPAAPRPALRALTRAGRFGVRASDGVLLPAAHLWCAEFPCARAAVHCYPASRCGNDRQQPQRQGVRLRCTRSSRPAASSTRSPRAT